MRLLLSHSQYYAAILLCLLVQVNIIPCANAADDLIGASSLFASEKKPGFPALSIENTETLATEETAPVDLLADTVTYDQQKNIVDAQGAVEISQMGRHLQAGYVSYDVNNDYITARDSIQLRETSGEIYYADSIELKNQMQDGTVINLTGIMTDGGNFSAEQGEKQGDQKMVMKKATYTACKKCDEKPDKTPFWEIKARDVEHDKERKMVSYKDATFEIKGVPVAYTPYFSHSDGSVKRKSGFLTPSIGFDSELGTSYQQDYYWDIAPNKDATVGLAAFTAEAPLAVGEYRHRFEKAELQLNGGVTYSSRNDANGSNTIVVDDEVRSHLFGNGTWHVNNNWRAGAEIEAVSDKQYLRQYNISNEDVLTNKLYVERFKARDYAKIEAIKFKDVRVSSSTIDQPDVLPEIYVSKVGKPNAMLGGRWRVDASALGLQREGHDQDTYRTSVQAGWNRLFTSDSGVKTSIDLMGRGDVYKTDDIIVSSTSSPTDESAARGFTSANVMTSLPFHKDIQDGHITLEPIAALTLASNIDDNRKIPNEDSEDVFLDSNNIFNPNRFPGLDRIEDEIHTTYGVRSGIHFDNGNRAELFLGQSYRLDDEDDNPFPNGSGLEENESDFVGNLSAAFANNFSVNYGLQLKNDTLTSQRHELDLTGTYGPVTLAGKYFYADALDGTNLDTRREQVRSSMKYQFTDTWSAFGAMQYDLARETEGLRQAIYGLDYQGQCVTFNINAKRNLTTDSSGDSGTQIVMRIGFKNIGEFETSPITVGQDDADTDEEELEDEVNNL